MKQIFPKEILHSTIEVHRFKNTVKSKVIYSILLLSIIIAALSLPFIFIDVYSTARGIIKPEKERNKIISLFSGKIDTIRIKQNQFVKKGDTLIIINNAIGKEQLNLLRSQFQDNQSFIMDISYLLNSKKVRSKKIQTYTYKKEFSQYEQQIRNLRTKYYKAKRDFERQDKLFQKHIIARVVHENSKYKLDLSLNDLRHFKKQQKNNWQITLTQLQNQEKEFRSNLLQAKQQQENHIITAPITGTIQNLIGLETNSILTAGSVIAEISPQTELIAECYVSPSDIGLLKKGSNVKFQIDAFNYNQWGMATGKIMDINKDITIINNRPMFRVVCKIDQHYLNLKNGFKGHLKKGMTFNVRFFIIKRSALDLLYDKVDDWFIPNGNPIQN